MPAPLALPIIMGAGGVAANLYAQSRLKKQAEKAYADLQKANQAAMGQMQDIYSMLESRDGLSLDRSLYDAYEQAARQESIQSQGRAFGEEQARDTMRQSSADAIARSMDVASTGADALGAIANISDQERQAMMRIDSEAAMRRAQSIESAKARLLDASREKAMFNQRADLLEFQDKRQREQDLMNFQSQMAQMERGFALDEISQQGAVASAKAGMWNTVGSGMSSIGSSLMDVYMNDQQNEMLMSMYSNKPAAQQERSSMFSSINDWWSGVESNIDARLGKKQKPVISDPFSAAQMNLPQNDFWNLPENEWQSPYSNIYRID